MVNYELIADNDPGGDLEAAFALMKAETITQPKDRKVNYVQIANEAGFTEASALEYRIKALVSTSNLPEWVHDALKSEGLNINDSQVSAQLNALVDGTTLTTAHVDAILAMKNEVSPKYPGIKLGHLETARLLRVEGKV